MENLFSYPTDLLLKPIGLIPNQVTYASIACEALSLLTLLLGWNRCTAVLFLIASQLDVIGFII